MPRSGCLQWTREALELIFCHVTIYPGKRPWHGAATLMLAAGFVISLQYKYYHLAQDIEERFDDIELSVIEIFSFISDEVWKWLLGFYVWLYILVLLADARLRLQRDSKKLD